MRPWWASTPDLALLIPKEADMAKGWRRGRFWLPLHSLLSSLIILALIIVALNLLAFDLEEETNPSLVIGVKSARNEVRVVVNNTIVYEASSGRGLHVLCLDSQHGQIMAARIFDTYLPKEEGTLISFMEMIAGANRIVVMAVFDEATFHLSNLTRAQIAQTMNSKLVFELGWRDMWAIVAGFKTKLYGERLSRSVSFEKWGDAVEFEVVVDIEDEMECSFGGDWHRKHFCSKYEGYGSLCDCHHPSTLPTLSKWSSTSSSPVAVIASSRPHYLLRSLSSLQSANTDSAIVVFVDTASDSNKSSETADLAEHLFKLPVVLHRNTDSSSNTSRSRTSQHYLFALTRIFEMFDQADSVIILEEDLQISPDFFNFFNETIPILLDDPTLLCVSAWNDQGYDHLAFSNDVLMRVDTMPGLGWALTKKTFLELKPIWPSPDKSWDWDMWLRQRSVRGERECLVPLVSRTFHFGSVGSNMNSFFQEKYFDRHAFYQGPNLHFANLDSLTSEKYDWQLLSDLEAAEVIEDLAIFCVNKTDLAKTWMGSKVLGKKLVSFVAMEHERDWIPWAKCLGIWDLDVRGQHKGVWRLQIMNNNNNDFDKEENDEYEYEEDVVVHDLYVVGVPLSPFSSAINQP